MGRLSKGIILAGLVAIVGIVFFIRRLEALSGISGRVLSDAGDQSKEFPTRQGILPMQQLSLPYYLISSLNWMNKETTSNKYYTEETQRDFQENRELFEKITCQSYCKDSSAQVKNRFGDKCSARFIYCSHCFKFTIINELCQEKSQASSVTIVKDRGIRWVG